MALDKLLIYHWQKPANGEISGFLKERITRNPSPHGIGWSVREDALKNWKVSFSAVQEDGVVLPHATELIWKGQRRQAALIVSEEGRALLRQNHGLLEQVGNAQRTGKEVGEGWEGKVHEEVISLRRDGINTRKQVAVKYYFPMVLPEHESSYDGVLYGIFTPAMDQMRVLQYLADHQKKENMFPGVHFVAPYLATLDISVAPLIPDSANLETELRKGLFVNGHDIRNVNISSQDRDRLYSIIAEQDAVLQEKYGTIDQRRRFTSVFSNAGYNIIRGITAWLSSRQEELIAHDLLTSAPEHVSFHDATQRNIVISIPAFCKLYERWKQDPSIADTWVDNAQVPINSLLLQDEFLYLVRQTAYVIEAMVTSGVIGRVGDDDY